MKRWLPWFIAVLGLCALVFASRSTSPSLLEDTDTIALVQRIQEVGDPMAWFKGDWPLQNHFYRPISTLAFELDLALSGTSERFGTTNALLAVACILLLFWMLRELTDSPWQTGIGSALFAVWHGWEHMLSHLSAVLPWLAALCLLGVLRGGREKLGACILAALGCLFLSTQLVPVDTFATRIVHWIPGRTASVMTIFALVSVAAYARYVRTNSQARIQEATSHDVPMTKSAQAPTKPKLPFFLLVVSALALVLALCSYEQAVMLPAVLFGVWLTFRLRGRESTLWPHLAFWLLLGAYFVVRSQLVPSDVSGYQEQQLRTGPGVWIAIGDYVLPGAYALYLNLGSLTAGLVLLVTVEFWSPIVLALSNLTTLAKAWFDRAWKWPLFGYLGMAFVAFLPMAWLQPFGHYHYWPSAFRAIYVVVLAAIVGKLVLNAASPPALQAPERRDPAPGSLLRP